MTIVVVTNKNYYTRHHERRSRTTKRMPKIVKWLQHIKGTHALALCVSSVDIPGTRVSYSIDVTRTHNMSSRDRKTTRRACYPPSRRSTRCTHVRVQQLPPPPHARASVQPPPRLRVRARVTLRVHLRRGKDFPPWKSISVEIST